MPNVYADVRSLRFTAKDGESREYEQSELTIDGEMQLFALLARTVQKLREADFPFNELGEVFGATPEDIDWGRAGALLSIALSQVPSLASEGAAIMLGMFPLDEHGRRNAQFADEVAFLRKTLHTADVIELLEAFTEQNDIERLRAPFGRAWRTAVVRSPLPPSAASIEPSTVSSAPDTEPPVTSGATTRGRRSTAP